VSSVNHNLDSIVGDKEAQELLKLVVWDLDGTLWDGVLLEGAVPHLRQGVTDVLMALDERGVLLSIASANEYDLVLPHLIRLEIDHYFLAPEIHFGEKDSSLKRISDRLGVRLTEMAFIDDEPFERALVQEKLPGVQTFDASEILSLACHLRLPKKTSTFEGGNRRHLISTELSRAIERTSYPNDESFLANSRMKFLGRRATLADRSRIHELATRANQMNATGHTVGVDHIDEAFSDPTCEVVVANMSDRFGDYGLIACAIMRHKGAMSSVEGLWISCRVSRRGVASAMFTWMGCRALAHGAQNITVMYRPNGRNRQAAFHLGQYGFRSTVSADSSILFELDLFTSLRSFPHWLTIDAK